MHSSTNCIYPAITISEVDIEEEEILTDKVDYFCTINLNYIYVYILEDYVLVEWLAEVQKALLDEDLDLCRNIRNLTRE